MPDSSAPRLNVHLDLLDQTPPGVSGSAQAGRHQEIGGAPSLQVYFACANAYTRVFRRPGNDAYLARCPRCGKSMRFPVGPGGTSTRSFTVSC